MFPYMYPYVPPPFMYPSSPPPPYHTLPPRMPPRNIGRQPQFPGSRVPPRNMWRNAPPNRRQTEQREIRRGWEQGTRGGEQDARQRLMTYPPGTSRGGRMAGPHGRAR